MPVSILRLLHDEKLVKAEDASEGERAGIWRRKAWDRGADRNEHRAVLLPSGRSILVLGC